MNSQSIASSINGNRFDPSRGAVRVHPEVLKLAGASFALQPYYRPSRSQPLAGREMRSSLRTTGLPKPCHPHGLGNGPLGAASFCSAGIPQHFIVKSISCEGENPWTKKSRKRTGQEFLDRPDGFRVTVPGLTRGLHPRSNGDLDRKRQVIYSSPVENPKWSGLPLRLNESQRRR
jgi:hypothetical protein